MKSESLFFLALLLAAVALGAACASVPTAPREGTYTPLEERGRQIFLGEGCYYSCHAMGTLSPAQARTVGVIPDLTKAPPRSDDWYLAYFINPPALLPKSPMPSYSHLSSDDLKALTAYLKRIRQGEPTPTPVPVAAEAIPQVPEGLTSYAAGRRVYRNYCQGCHGEGGNGAGAVAHVLSPEPRDFTDVIWMSKQTEVYLFSVITNGKANTAMPGYADTLSLQERALVLHFIKYFADPVTKQRLEEGLPLK